MKTTWVEENWAVTLSGPITPYDDFTQSFFSEADLIAGTKNISTWWNYSTSKQFFGNCTETITLEFINQHDIINSIYSFESEETGYVFCPPPKEAGGGGYYLFGMIGMIIGAVVIIIGIISSIAGYSMLIAWSTIHVIQFVNYLPMHYIYMPSSVVKFCQGFDFLNLKVDLLRDLVWDRVIVWYFDVDWKAIDYKYIRAGFGFTNALYNTLDLLIIWAVFFLFMLVFWILKKILNKFALIVNLEENYRKSIFFALINFSYMKLTFTAMLTYRYAKYTTWEELIGNAFAFIYMLFAIFWPPFEAWQAILFHREV